MKQGREAQQEAREMPGQAMRRTSSPLPVLFISLFPLFLGADYERWPVGLVFVVMGLTFIFAPPRERIGGALPWHFAGLFLASLTAFLPSSLVGIPEWRARLVDVTGIELAPTLSAQPWISLDHVALFAGGLLWLYYLLSRSWATREREMATYVLAGASILFICIALTGHFLGVNPPFWEGQNYLGPFGNRNQFASVLAMAGLVLAGCAYRDVNHQRPARALLWGAGLALAFTATVINGSRAGVLLFFGGLGAWIAVVATLRKSTAQFAIAGSGVLILAAAFFLFGGSTLKRLQTQSADLPASVKAERRMEIFRDSFEVGRQSPLFGVGLGNFGSAYARVRDHDEPRFLDRVAQPDSDWVWLAAETGIVGLGFALAAAFLLLKGARPRRHGSRRQPGAVLQSAGFVAGAVFALNAVVSIPAHCMPVALVGMLVIALAHRPSRSKDDQLRRSRLLPALYRLAGAATVLTGAAWVATAWLRIPLPGPLAVKILTERCSASEEERRLDEALGLINEAIRLEPLRYRHYFKRALLVAGLGRPLDEVIAEFQIARHLEPVHPVIPLGEVGFWLDLRPSYAIEPLREAMRRWPTASGQYFTDAMQASGRDALFRKRLGEFASEDPDRHLRFLSGASASECAAGLDQILADDPALDRFDRRQKRTFFQLWYSKGDREKLRSALIGHPEWHEAGWFEMARFAAEDRDFEAAWRLAFKHVGAPRIPAFSNTARLESLRSALAADPANLVTALNLHHAEMRASHHDLALAAIEAALRIDGCPDYAHYLHSRSLGELGRFQEAWDSLMAFISKAGAGS